MLHGMKSWSSARGKFREKLNLELKLCFNLDVKFCIGEFELGQIVFRFDFELGI